MDSSPYSPLVREHLRQPRNRGELSDPSGLGFDENPVCGDVMTVWIRVDDAVIREASFAVRGCDPSIAAGSVLTELVTALTLDEALEITPQAVMDALGGLPPVKRHCAFLAVRALRNALSNYRSREET